jgi:hypothetical protein
MAEKMKKNLLGREVSKSTTKTRNTEGGYTRSKTKVVFDKQGNVIKSKVKSTSYSPSGETSSKMQKYKPTGTTVTKRKFSDIGKTTSSKQRPGIMPVRGSMKK